MLVSKLLSQHPNNQNYVKKMLKSKKVRIIYKRKPKDNGSEIDPNSDLARTKIFKHFSLPAKDQKFYEMEPKDEQDSTAPRQIKQGALGSTVLDFITNGDTSPCAGLEAS
jgi:hypothetical protein